MAEQTQKVLIDVTIKSNNEEQVKKLAAYKGEINKLKEAQKELIKTEGAGSKKAAELGVQIKALGTESKALEKNIQSNIKAQNQQVGSLAQLKTQLSLDTAAYDKLSKAEKKSAEGKALQQKIKSTTDDLKKQESALGNNRREVGNYGKATQGAGKNLAAMAVGITAAIAAVKALYSAVKQSVTLFLTQEDAALKVDTAFGDFASQINNAADATQNLTRVGNEQYQKLAVLASNMGLANSEVNQTVQDSIGLAELYAGAGLSQETAIKGLTLAREGDYTQLQRYIPALKSATTEAEKQAILNEVTAKGFQTAIDNTASYSGQLAQLKNTYGDLQEVIGGQALKGIFNIEDGGKIKDTINDISEALEKTNFITKLIQEYTGAFKKLLEPIFDLAQKFGIVTDKAESLEVIFNVLIGVFNLLILPTKLIYGFIGNLITQFSSLYDILTGVKEFSFENVLIIWKETLLSLISPFTDVIGLTDELSKTLGIAGDEVQVLSEQTKKYGTAFGDLKAEYQAFKEEVAATTEEMKKQEEALAKLKAEEDALADVRKKSEKFSATLFGINQEYEKEIALTEDSTKKGAARLVQLQDTFNAYESFFAAGGYTGNEIAKLKELQKEINATTYLSIEQIDDTSDAYLESYETDLEEFDNYQTKKLESKYEGDAAFLAAEEERIAKQSELDLKAEADRTAAIKKAADVEKSIRQQSVKIAGDLLQSALDNELAQAEGNEEKQKQIRKKYAAAQAIVSISQIAINTQQAVSKTIAELGGVGAITPAGALLIAGIVGNGIAQAALVKTQASNIAKAERGALLSGNRHSSGGITIEAEDGEAIINRRSTAKFLPLLSAINESGGGVPFVKPFADGGYVSRSAIGSGGGVSASQIAQAVRTAMQEVKIYTAVTDIQREGQKYAEVTSNGSF